MSIIQGLWVEDNLSRIERLSVKSFLDHGHDVHVYSYAPQLSGLPEGAVLRDASAILPKERIWQYSNGAERGSWAGVANHFRYQLLNTRGGTWVDLDVICLRPFPDDPAFISGQKVVDGAVEAGNQVMRLPPGHPLLTAAIAACESKDPKDIRFGETGPKLIQRLIAELKMEALVTPVAFANPLPGVVFEEAFLAEYSDWLERLETMPKAYGVHLWNEKGRRRGYKKDVWYDPSCLLERLAKRHGLEPLTSATAYEDGQVLRAQLLALKAGKKERRPAADIRLGLLTKALDADPACAHAQRQVVEMAGEHPDLIRRWLTTRPRPLPRILRKRLPRVVLGET